MAVYPSTYPDGTPYAVIPLGTNTVNVSGSSALSNALASATAGQRIVLANGTYSGAFSVSGKNGSSAAGISIEAANQHGAVFASGSTISVNNSSWVTLKGLSFPYELSSGNLVQFRGNSHHCRVTRCLFGPTSVGSPGSSKSPFVYMGDTTNHIRIDHCEMRNKANPGNAILGDGNFDTYNPVRWIRIDHNLIRSIKPEVDNEKEPIRLGVSTMSKKLTNSVIERNVFFDCICEPEVVSGKACAIRVTGNTVLRSIGGLVIRHGTNSVMSDNYIVDRQDTFGDTIGSGGFRFYDADHVISHNYVDDVYGGNYQGPLLLDTGDAEGSSTNLSAHWRVIGAMVERNVIVNCPEGIRIGDNYSSVPRDCTIRDNLVVNAATGAAITQRVAPSNTVISNNQYFASTTAAGMAQGADTIWRKPGWGPRVTYLQQTDVGPDADLDDTDGTGAEIGGGGGTPVAVPADVLNIGPDPDQNHFQLQWAADGASAITITEFDEVADGFAVDPYFVVVQEADRPPAVQFRVRADAPTTPNSSEPRSELRETRADGSEMAFDAMVGEHSLRTRFRVTHLPPDDPEVVVAQLHNGVTGDRISVRTQFTSNLVKLLVRINGTQANPRLSESYAIGEEREIELRVRDGGLVEVYYEGSTSPLITGQLEPSGAGASWFWKVGAYAAFNETTTSASEYVTVEHRDLQVAHSGARVDAGEDATVIAGQPFERPALELGLTGISSRRWTIVSRPAGPDPGDPGGDMTTAAIRHGWGTPHPVSDEFNYVGPPNPSKWSLPSSPWPGHAGNGRRVAERSWVDGEKLIMTGLENGDTGYMRQQLYTQYGRWEARTRSYETSTSGSGRYHPLFLIWPRSEDRPLDGEYDWLENSVPGDSKIGAFMHYPHPGTSTVQQEHFTKACDLSQWNNIGFEWTSQHLKGFLNGEEWFSVSGGANSVRRDIQTMPEGSLRIQLDNFHGSSGNRPATFEVQWMRFYPL